MLLMRDRAHLSHLNFGPGLDTSNPANPLFLILPLGFRVPFVSHLHVVEFSIISYVLLYLQTKV